jgi:hypothetical protein
MKIDLYKTEPYFNTYHIYNDDKYLLVGIIEYHWNCKERYYIGWKLDNPTKLPGHNTGETASFNTIEEAMIYSVGEIIQFR